MARSWGRKLEEAIPILTLGAGLLALFFGVDNWWVIFVVGWVVLTPLADILVDDGTDEAIEQGVREAARSSIEDAVGSTDGGGQDRTTEDALETLRDRYARGELTEAQFERKVERLLETETVEDARDRLVDDGTDLERELDRE